ncbi:MAG: hypothetical protein SNJ52_02575 [Verrucomicrobiia bacterium]
MNVSWLPEMPAERWCLLVAISMLAALLPSATRVALRDAWRCVRCYPILLFLPGLMGVAGALSVVWLDIAVQFGGDSPPILFESIWAWEPERGNVFTPGQIEQAGIGFTGLFHALTAVGPLAAVVALLYLGNYRGLRGPIAGSLRARYGHHGDRLVLLLLICAACSVLRLVFVSLGPIYFSSPGRLPLLEVGLVVDLFGSAFNHLCSVFLQVLLIGVVLCWIEGLRPDMRLLRKTAVCFAAVLPFSGTVVFLTLLLVQLPFTLAAFGFVPIEYADWALEVFEKWIALLLLLCHSVQIRLVIGRGSVRAALRSHVRFFLRHWGRVVGFLWLAALLYVGVRLGTVWITLALGSSAAGLLGKLLFPFVQALVHGLLLAAWVTLIVEADTSAEGKGVAY